MTPDPARGGSGSIEATPYPQQQQAQTGARTDQYDSVIVGGGPAGLSAAIYLARFNRSVLIIDGAEGRSTTHELNENYLGFPDGIASRELRERGRAQAIRFGADCADGIVSAITRNSEMFRVEADVCGVAARTVILATGAIDQFPDIADVENYLGRSLFWCITCDGYKTRGKRVVVVGADDEAAVTAMQFLDFTQSVSVVTNRRTGEAKLSDRSRRNLQASGIALQEGEIAHVRGDDGMIRQIELSDGTSLEADCVFSQQGSKPNVDLARSLGVELTDGDWIKVDEEQRTNVPRVYAAGDVTRVFAHQVVTAAHEGATAGQAANYDLYRPEQRSE